MDVTGRLRAAFGAKTSELAVSRLSSAAKGDAPVLEYATCIRELVRDACPEFYDASGKVKSICVPAHKAALYRHFLIGLSPQEKLLLSRQNVSTFDAALDVLRREETLVEAFGEEERRAGARVRWTDREVMNVAGARTWSPLRVAVRVGRIPRAVRVTVRSWSGRAGARVRLAAPRGGPAPPAGARAAPRVRPLVAALEARLAVMTRRGLLVATRGARLAVVARRGLLAVATRDRRLAGMTRRRTVKRSGGRGAPAGGAARRRRRTAHGGRYAAGPAVAMGTSSGSAQTAIRAAWTSGDDTSDYSGNCERLPGE